MSTKRGVRQALPVYGGFFLLGFAGWLQDECNGDISPTELRNSVIRYNSSCSAIGGGARWASSTCFALSKRLTLTSWYLSSFVSRSEEHTSELQSHSFILYAV